MAVTEAKTRGREMFAEALKKTKRLWITIQCLRKRKQCTVNTVCSGDGVLLKGCGGSVEGIL